jgi:hypothetical protein
MLNVLCLMLALFAQPQVGAPEPQTSKGPAPSPALRSDLALAYMRFERSLRGQKLSSDRTEKLNKAFDAATAKVGETAAAWFLTARTEAPACR